jgi:hypothetical protein
MADFDDENVLKVNFRQKRTKLGAKPQPKFLQPKTIGIAVAVILIAVILALQVVFPSR